MTNSLIVQALNITCLVAFALVLVLRARSDINRQVRALRETLMAPTPEQKKLELRSKIESLQRELRLLEEAPTTSALRAPEAQS